VLNVKSPTNRQASLARLLQIVMELQGDRTPNARELAASCEVSRRTIFRDLDTIEMAGLRISYDGKRLGYRLANDRGFQVMPVEPDEAIALYLLANQWHGVDELQIGRKARTGATKLLRALPAASRSRIEGLTSITPRIGSRNTTYEYHDTLLRGLMDGVRLGFELAATRDLPEVMTMFSPYRLFYDHGWQILGHSSYHQDVRAIPVNQVRKLVTTDEVAIIPPRFRPETRETSLWPSTSHLVVPQEVLVRADPGDICFMTESGWVPHRNSSPGPDGRIDVAFLVERLDEFVRWYLGSGEKLEVLAPQELRRRIREAAQRLALRYAFDDPKGSLNTPKTMTNPAKPAVFHP
jgi:predicted DNA-binding transcriptional regulator YafY